MKIIDETPRFHFKTWWTTYIENERTGKIALSLFSIGIFLILCLLSYKNVSDAFFVLYLYIGIIFGMIVAVGMYLLWSAVKIRYQKRKKLPTQKTQFVEVNYSIH